MGLGWICVNDETKRFKASAILWPSSTKAEILACFTALTTAPNRAKVTLHTDSTATIDGFRRLPELKRLSTRKREKIPNYPVWLLISYVIDQLNLVVKLVKVKAHSGDRLNDKADTLAKEAVSTGPRLNINIAAIPDLRLFMACDQLEIEASSRRCIKQLHDAHNLYGLLQLHRFEHNLLLSENQHIRWAATTYMFNNNKI